MLLFLAALEKVLLDQGFPVPAGGGVAAAIQTYHHAAQPQPAAVGEQKYR